MTGFHDHDVSRKRAPAFSLRLKTGLKPKNFGPGPYTIEQQWTHRGRYEAPKFTMASKPPSKGKFMKEVCSTKKKA